MTRYLVDTTSWIDASKGIEPPLSRLVALIDDPTHEVGVCDVVVAEFMAGVRPEDRTVWRRFFESLPYWDVPFVAAIQAGGDRYTYARMGQQLATVDALIAAVARAHGALLITENAKHYPMPDIALLSLRT